MSKINKRYYWLKLPENVFQDLSFKQLRTLPGGADLTIIYLKMMLLSIKDQGKIFRQDDNIPFHEELGLILNEEQNAVLLLLNFLLSKNLLFESSGEYFLPEAADKIGSETASTRRSQKSRLEAKNQGVLQCNTNATPLQRREDIEKDIDNKNSSSTIQVGKQNTNQINKSNIVTPIGDLNKGNNGISNAAAAVFREFGIDEDQWPKYSNCTDEEIQKYAAAVRNKNSVNNPSGLFLYLLKSHRKVENGILHKEKIRQQEIIRKQKITDYCNCCNKRKNEDWLCQKDGRRYDFSVANWIECEYCEVLKNEQ